MNRTGKRGETYHPSSRTPALPPKPSSKIKGGRPGSTPATSRTNQTPSHPHHSPTYTPQPGNTPQTPDQPQTSRRLFARVTHTQSNVMRSVINQSINQSIRVPRHREVKGNKIRGRTRLEQHKARLMLHPPSPSTCQNQAKYPSRQVLTNHTGTKHTHRDHPPVPQTSDLPPTLLAIPTPVTRPPRTRTISVDRHQ